VTRIAITLLSLATFAAGLLAQTPGRGAAAPSASPVAQAKPLDIYVLDTEGGKATFFLTPAGQVVLIDTGNPGTRDLERIVSAAETLGVKQIDYLITTHYHGDHMGSLLEVAKRIPIVHFVDHGPTVEPSPNATTFQAAYAELKAKAKYTVAKPGDQLPVTGLDWRIVSSAGNVLKTPLPGGGAPNPACKDFVPKDPNYHGGLENGQSVGSVITYGRFRAVDLGDLLWNVEGQLMCPNNPIGTVDVYFATHHGLDYSGSPALVHALQPRVSVMQNGPRKGGAPSSIAIMRTSPGMEDLWQLHWGNAAGIDQNSAGVFIANVDDNATVATVLTAPPRGAGPGRGPGAPAAQGAGPVAAAPAGPSAPAAPGAPAGQSSAPAAANAPAGTPAAPAVPLQSPAHTPAYWIKVSAMSDGTFTVTNGRNGFSKTYTKR
jgi:beta-lactamase superfamily II metal-dependent hydrolase